MRDEAKTKQELIEELVALRRWRSDLVPTEPCSSWSEKAAVTTEARLQSEADLQPELIIRLLPDGTLTFVNEACCRYFKKRPDELLGQSFWSYLHEEDRAIFHACLATLTTEEPLATIRQRVLNPEGEVRWQQWTNRAIFDAQNRLLECQSTARDITRCTCLADSGPDRSSELVQTNQQLRREIEKRKRTEQKLRHSAQRYREFYESSRDGYAIVNTGDRILESNSAFKEMLGYTKRELRKKTIYDITPRKWHSLEREVIREQVQQYGYSPVYQKEYIRKDGTIFPVEVRSYLLRNSRGKQKGMWHFVRDISQWQQAEDALRTSEQRYRAVTEDMPAMVCRFLADGTLTFVNKFYCEYFKRAKEELLGQNFFQFIPADQRDEVKRNFTLLKKQSPMITYEHSVCASDTSIRWQQWSVRALFNEAEEVVEYQSIGMDITESKQAQEEKNNLLKHLQHAQKMEAIGTLAGGIAHDFNNLLQSIMGYADLLLLSSHTQDVIIRATEQITRAAERGADLTRQLLTFSRKVESKLRLINLNTEVEKTKKLLERTLPKMIAIELDLEQGLKTVNADPAQIGQVLMNLALNAKDAMPDGGKLTVRTTNLAAQATPAKARGANPTPHYVSLSVTDTGHGMHKETVEHIFDPFFTTKGLASGTGLGLAMVYGIVQSHGGHIECRSKIGSGTTFNIYFPAMELLAEPERVLLLDSPQGGKETILLVDDEQPIRDLIQKSLAQLGYTVRTATDTQSALAIYRQELDHIDLVILDLIMPGLSGKHCLEEILKMNPKAKVLISSGYCDVPHIKEMLAGGAKRFLSKPYQLHELFQVIRNVIESK